MVSLTNFKSVNELNILTNSDYSETLSSNNLSDQPYGNQQQQHNIKKYHFNQQATIEAKPHDLLKRSSSDSSNNYLNNDQHFEIRWNNLTYEVEPKWYRQKWDALTSGGDGKRAGKTNILNSLSGSVKSGQVTAILGPSGAGKTSLLGCLTGKNKSGVSGSIQVISNRHKPMSTCQIPQKG